MVYEHTNGTNGNGYDENHDEIVISGISGRFPKSNNMSEFAYNLYNSVDMLDDSEDRFKHIYSSHPRRFGKINNLEKFDSSFFSLLSKTANVIDPQGRILLECCYEAIVDAGVCPKSLAGGNCGVFVGCFNFDSLESWVFDQDVDGMALGGNALFTMANRVSFCLGLNGPSLGVDTACSSSLYALDLAVKSIKNGDCDAALVAGTNLILNPKATNDLNKAGILATNGIPRPFDQNGSGYVRAEAVCVIFLQRSRNAKRIYSTVVHCKVNNDGFKKEGPTFPSRQLQKDLFAKLYKDLKMDPSCVDYVEAHATGTVLGDPQEIQSIDEVFSDKRKKPLPIGSLKSNIGHAEGAAGVCSIAKSILIFENEKLIPNINLTAIRKDCPALNEGRLRVVESVESFDGSLIAVNSFGILGANAHTLLRRNEKKKINLGLPEDDLPRLVMWSGRSEDSINSIFDDITKRPLDSEFIALLQSTQTDTNPLNTYRGYGIFQKAYNKDENASCVERNIHHFNDTKRPIVWVYSGVGSQWCGMGKDLMKIPLMAQVIEKCHRILKPKGLNLKSILTSSDESTFDNILHTFVGIAAIQIGLTDILKRLGIEPDYIIGHSVGELGCAYADGGLTMEEMILSAYSRGMAVNEIKRQTGAMAAIGMGYQELKKIVPKGIEIACHNSSDSCTVSGNVDDVRAFVKDAKAKKILAKEIHSSGIPFHSSFIASSGPNLLKRLDDIIKNEKKRSPKWISTSVPQNDLQNRNNQYSSAYYHTNNLLKPVLFEEGLEQLPKNAMTIEIAPHSLLQPIIQKAFADGLYINLTKRMATDSSNLLLNSLGRMFQYGLDINISKLYPAISFPVSKSTPMISPLIKWNHSENYAVPLYDSFKRCDKRNVTINLQDPRYEYIQGHTLDGRVLFPATAYLCLVWETFAMMMGTLQNNICVVFEDVKLLRATAMTKGEDIDMTVLIQRGSGRFEIVEGGATLVNGFIRTGENEKFSNIKKASGKLSDENSVLEHKDFYKELRLRGYHYYGLFKGVRNVTSNGDYGEIEWNNNWVTFTDCMLQISIVGNENRGLCLPTSIRKITINPMEHLKLLRQNSTKSQVEVNCNSNLKVIQSGGIEICDLEASFVNRRPLPYDPVLESHRFISHFPTPQLSNYDMAKFCMQLALENDTMKKVTLIEFDAMDDHEHLSEFFLRALEDLPLITSEIHYLTTKQIDLKGITVHDEQLSSFNNINIIVKSGISTDLDFLKTACDAMDGKGFILSRESKSLQQSNLTLPENFRLIACITMETEFLFMIQCYKSQDISESTIVKIPTIYENFSWIEELKEAVANGPTLIYSDTKKDVSGILGLVNCLRREPNGQQNITCVLVDDDNAPEFNLSLPFYKNQLKLGLSINVFKDKKWGSYKHFSLKKDNEAKSRTGHCFANSLSRGDLSSMTWMNGALDIKQVNRNLVEIHYAALNFRDVMIATGRILLDSEFENRIEQQYNLGFEYSGVTQDGRRVMGMIASKAISTHIMPKELLLIDVPDNWTLEEAASVPVVYFTVYTAFFLSTNIKPGKSILIHAGSGGVGLAAIRIAFAYGLDVFTTVSSKEKKEFLLNEFPQLKPENIGNSRDITFEEMVMENTNGKGVDYVLNSLSEEKLQASIRCLADNGNFLEVGKFDMLNKSKIHLGHFMRGITFRAVICNEKQMLNQIDETRNLVNMIRHDIERGIVKPLRTTAFNASEIEKAFRFLATGKHMGKVVLKMRPNDKSHESLPISVVPRIYCNPKHSYIIPGGLGGFGLELADWLVLRDCKKLVLSSSRGISNSYQTYRIKIWESYGVKVIINTCDIMKKSGCEKLISDAIKLGPVGGIFNLAVVLRDGILENQNETAFRESFGPKAIATKHLDEISRKLCPELEQFVVFSSVSCGRGNAGQTNYGMANSIMERIVEKRFNDGLPGKAIQWGAIGEVGLVANMQESNVELEIGGTLQQRISSCLQVMDKLLASNEPIVASMVVAEKRHDTKGNKNIVEAIMHVMGIREIKSISMDSTLSELGMDSLMGVEIHQLLERDFDCVVTTEEMRSFSLSELEKKVKSSIKSATSVGATSGQVKEPSYIELILNGFEESIHNKDIIITLNEGTNSSTTKVLIIPGIEGMAGSTWLKFAKKLQFPTYALQFIKTSHLRDFEEIYDAIIEDVVNLYKDSDHFVLIGYSFGSMYGMKIASRLESMGKKGNLIVIDGSPNFLKTQANKYIPAHFVDDDIQNLLLINACNKLYGTKSDKIKENIMKQTSWESKLNQFEASFLATQKDLQYDQSRSTLEAIFYRIKITLTTDKLQFPVLQKTPLILVKPSISNIAIESDYGLKKYSRDEIRIETIDGDHLSIIESNELIDIVSSCASKSII